MKKGNLENGLRIIYEKSSSALTSFTIGFEAGANREEKHQIGLAHVVEHMIFKGTKKRNEREINEMIDAVFGFSNAMTNFPYVVYYGTTLAEELEKGIEIYSDILLHPTFPEEGFEEEIQVIVEELKEWSEDKVQHCEDILFSNAFPNRRIGQLIIGNKHSITHFTLAEVKAFYKTHYTPENCVISVVSNLGFEEVEKIMKTYFGHWQGAKTKGEKAQNNSFVLYEKNTAALFKKVDAHMEGAKIQYCFPIHELNEKEVMALRLFNLLFGEGTSSLLYEHIRTQNGLAYEVGSSIKNEKGIKLFLISMGTSPEKVEQAINIINKKTTGVLQEKQYFTETYMEKLRKRLKIRSALGRERSIQSSMQLCIYELMYETAGLLEEELEIINTIQGEDLEAVVKKVLQNPTIQVVSAI